MSATLSVETGVGRIVGRREQGVGVFRGIPYAEPPTGRLRFAAPVMRRPFGQTFEAFAYGPSAPQRAVLPAPLKAIGGLLARTGDDCLNLNIWTSDVRGRAPVLVFLHGGAFILGAGGQFPGDDLARHGAIVVVTLNYRLGLPGYNAFSELFPDDERFASNAGLRDQRLALQWIRDNIEAFGGDPERVTLAGESAGGTSVAYHLVSPASHGLFQAAIVQSGGLNLLFSREAAVEVAERAAKELGAVDRPDALFDESVETIVATGMALERPYGTLSIRPYACPHDLPAKSVEGLHRAAAAVPTMVGTTRDEFSFFAGLPISGVPSEWEALMLWLETLAGPERATAIRDLYGDGRDARIRFGTDLMFKMTSIHLADRQSEQVPTFMYRLDWEAKGMLRRLGATHSVDLPLLFESFLNPMRSVYLGILPDTGRRQLGERMRNHWVAFTRDHCPGQGWPAYDRGARRTMIFDVRDRIETDPEIDRRPGWEGIDGFAP